MEHDHCQCNRRITQLEEAVKALSRKPMPFSCPKCGVSFAHALELNDHACQADSANTPMIEPCRKCGSPLAYYPSLGMHACPKCGERPRSEPLKRAVDHLHEATVNLEQECSARQLEKRECSLVWSQREAVRTILVELGAISQGENSCPT